MTRKQKINMIMGEVQAGDSVTIYDGEYEGEQATVIYCAGNVMVQLDSGKQAYVNWGDLVR